MAQQAFKKYDQIEVLEYVTKPAGKSVVLFHGYGADSSDLAGLTSYMKAKVDNWYFPNGGQPAFGLPMGRSWFPIDVNALEQAMRSGEHRSYATARPPGLDAAVKGAIKMLERMNLDYENTIIGGFSQGAMLATEIILQSRHNFKGLLILSGALIDQPLLEKNAPLRKGFSYFQSHGKNDVILAHGGAEALHQILKRSGWIGDFHSFDGGHEIPLPIIQKMDAYIKSRLGV